MSKEHNYYKETEYLLYNYKMFQISIENMKRDIELLKEECGVSGVNTEGINTSKTYKVTSIAEETALSNAEKIEYLERSIARVEKKIEKIDRTLEGLTEEEKKILVNRYFEGKQWYVVAYKVGYSERHCKRLRNEAIEKMITGLFGIKQEVEK